MQEIIVVNNPALMPLYNYVAKKSGYNVKVLSEVQTIAALHNGKCTAALVSPLVYAAISKENNYKILKNKLLALEDYSGAFTLNLAPNKKKLTKLYTETLNEFVLVCAKLVLSERFGIEVKLVGNTAEADIVLTIGNENFSDYVKLDLTEYWYDTFEFPLILGFWIVKNETTNSSDLVAEIDSFCSVFVASEQIIATPLDEKDYEKQGIKHWNWKDDFTATLEKTNDLLFYRGFAGEIADISFAKNE